MSKFSVAFPLPTSAATKWNYKALFSRSSPLSLSLSLSVAMLNIFAQFFSDLLTTLCFAQSLLIFSTNKILPTFYQIPNTKQTTFDIRALCNHSWGICECTCCAKLPPPQSSVSTITVVVVGIKTEIQQTCIRYWLPILLTVYWWLHTVNVLSLKRKIVFLAYNSPRNINLLQSDVVVVLVVVAVQRTRGDLYVNWLCEIRIENSIAIMESDFRYNIPVLRVQVLLFCRQHLTIGWLVGRRVDWFCVCFCAGNALVLAAYSEIKFQLFSKFFFFGMCRRVFAVFREEYNV